MHADDSLKITTHYTRENQSELSSMETVKINRKTFGYVQTCYINKNQHATHDRNSQSGYVDTPMKKYVLS